jgi:hypothetical protein
LIPSATVAVASPVLDQDEPGRVILLLDHVEACNTRFANAVARILERRGLEGLDRIRLDVDVDMNHQHQRISLRVRPGIGLFGAFRYDCIQAVGSALETVVCRQSVRSL